VWRQRQLFAATFGYAVPDGLPDYGLDRSRLPETPLPRGYVVLAHGTSWPNKLWPVPHWQALAAQVEGAGLVPALPVGSEADSARADVIAASTRGAVRLPPLELDRIAQVIAGASGVVAVDTGLAHLAAALGVPCVSLYGPTAAARTGTVGSGQSHIAATLDCAPCLDRRCRLLDEPRAPAPCMASLPAEAVWARLRLAMTAGEGGAGPAGPDAAPHRPASGPLKGRSVPAQE
jgi:heptosyltransferase-1